jgi:AraC family transcriptional regulator of adaptative response / DNA-3-methyladenine glycosylase II
MAGFRQTPATRGGINTLMELDEATCYRALASRDRRFEGRFVVAVRTTGVYCRPGCPAPLPRRRNVHFFACSAAAEDAGFRPCRRCRPDAALGTPAWAGTSATVARALRLIAEGQLDEIAGDGLAERLGVGDRHLRRLFAERLGASPAAIARTRRVHFARQLIDSTVMPMTEVALAAGFASVRAFNEAVRRTFQRSPREMRRAALRETGAGLTLRLPYRAPLDWAALLAFLGARAIPGVERVEPGSYARTVRLGGRAGRLTAVPREAERVLEVRLEPAPGADLMPACERVSRLFDLGADPLAVASHLGRDPLLGPILRAHPGLRVPGAWDGFEVAVRAVLGQQVSVAAATTLAGRVAAAFGERVADGELGLLFPTAEGLADADLSAIGMPASRARTLRELSRAVADGRIRFTTAAGLDDAMASLRAIPGIGPWTAAYIAMRALGEPDALPAGDLGLRRALARRGPLPSADQVEERAEAWRPWRAYATVALWAALLTKERA